jgi:hypothetical protein
VAGSKPDTKAPKSGTSEAAKEGGAGRGETFKPGMSVLLP